MATSTTLVLTFASETKATNVSSILSNNYLFAQSQNGKTLSFRLSDANTPNLLLKKIDNILDDECLFVDYTFETI